MSTDAYRRAPRRRFDRTTKLRILAACDVPGATVSRVAQEHAINVNLLHKWRRAQAESVAARPQSSKSAAIATRAQRKADAVDVAPTFVPLSVARSSTDDTIHVEVRRRDTHVAIRWPRSAAAECASWLRELLR